MRSQFLFLPFPPPTKWMNLRLSGGKYAQLPFLVQRVHLRKLIRQSLIYLMACIKKNQTFVQVLRYAPMLHFLCGQLQFS